MDVPNVEVLVGERVLLSVSDNWSFRNAGVQEYRVLEVSPSRNWIKLINLNGNKFWKAIKDVQYVETLKTIRKWKEGTDEDKANG